MNAPSAEADPTMLGGIQWHGIMQVGLMNSKVLDTTRWRLATQSLGRCDVVGGLMFRGVPPVVYVRVIVSGSVMTVIGWEAFLFWMNTGVPIYRSVPVLLPAGIASALVCPVLVRNPPWAALIVGTVFPYLVCLAGCLYCGAGVYFLQWVVGFWYLFIPAGCIGALAIRLVVGPISANPQGFEVVMPTVQDDAHI